MNFELGVVILSDGSFLLRSLGENGSEDGVSGGGRSSVRLQVVPIRAGADHRAQNDVHHPPGKLIRSVLLLLPCQRRSLPVTVGTCWKGGLALQRLEGSSCL